MLVDPKQLLKHNGRMEVFFLVGGEWSYRVFFIIMTSSELASFVEKETF